jgi:hypothetical protein
MIRRARRKGCSPAESAVNDKTPAAHKFIPMTPGATLSCPKCHLGLDPTHVEAGQEVTCAACRSGLTVRLFPAFTTPPEAVSTSSGERALDGEAVCFFHPEKRAATTCERCGRFLCALCDVPFGGKHLCPSCLDTSKLPDLINRRVVWGAVAANIGLWPLILLVVCFPMWFLGFITGPTAIILGLWKWNAPGSLVRGRRPWLTVLGILGGLLQIAAICGFIGVLVWSARR